MYTRDFLDNVIDEAHQKGGTEVVVDGPEVAYSLVDALLTRVEALTGDAHTLACSGTNVPGKYTLTVMWCGEST